MHRLLIFILLSFTLFGRQTRYWSIFDSKLWKGGPQNAGRPAFFLSTSYLIILLHLLIVLTSSSYLWCQLGKLFFLQFYLTFLIFFNYDLYITVREIDLDKIGYLLSLSNDDKITCYWCHLIIFQTQSPFNMNFFSEQ